MGRDQGLILRKLDNIDFIFGPRDDNSVALLAAVMQNEAR
jgi:hypothetical protein